jgi:hypothetical protein
MRACVFAIVFACLQAAVHAEKVDDRKFGFSLVVPEGFKPFPEGKNDKETLYSFVLGDPTDEDADVVLNVRRLRGTFPITQRLKPSDLAKASEAFGAPVELETVRWSGHTLDVMKMTMDTPKAGLMNAYTVQFPLRPEGIEVVVGGIKARSGEVRKYLDSVAGSFRGEKINTGTTGPAFDVRSMSKEERMQKLITGVIQLAVFSIVVILVLRAIFGKKKSPRTPPPPLPPGAA